MGTRGIPNQYGGFEQFAQYLSDGLTKKGHDVYVYNSSLHPYKENKWQDVHIIHCKDWENRFGTAGQFIYDLNCINDSRNRNFDILLHLGYTSDSIWHWRWPSQTRHLVNMDGLEWRRSKYNGLTRSFLKKAEAWAANRADQLVADSKGIQHYIAEKYGRTPVYIAYGASIFTNPDSTCLSKYALTPWSYSLVIARMEPENNIETIIKGFLSTNPAQPLVIVGNISNKYGKILRETYKDARVRFVEAIYDNNTINNLRYHSSKYIHGHSVGGTNPSLLEAMACGCSIIAHDNIFNKAVLQENADYFKDETSLAILLIRTQQKEAIEKRRESNFEKIRSDYNWQKIIDAYGELIVETGR